MILEWTESTLCLIHSKYLQDKKQDISAKVVLDEKQLLLGRMQVIKIKFRFFLTFKILHHYQTRIGALSLFKIFLCSASIIDDHHSLLEFVL
mmetsp:Transcript_28057/g.74022  ORF Transcript_28057/g.74022 Transcript_28057/m.74022 type:complete len:92 (-) Transcript_28057:228-503(-)